MNKPTPVLCPVCWHRDTIHAQQGGEDVIHDDPAIMRWVVCREREGKPPTMPGELSGGVWECDYCGVRLEPEAAYLMIDAVIKASDPDSDSITEDTYGRVTAEDARRARWGTHAV